jgi:hypothetical protein
MPLTRTAIDKLKIIYRKQYGEDLTDDAADEMGNRLLRLFAVLMRLPTRPPDAADKGSNPVAFD